MQEPEGGQGEGDSDDLKTGLRSWDEGYDIGKQNVVECIQVASREWGIMIL